MAVIGLWLSGLFIFSCCSCLGVATVYGDRSGVKGPGDLPAVSREHLLATKLMQKGERLVVYKDNTVWVQGTDFYVVTDRRLIHHRPASDKIIPLTEVATVESYGKGSDWTYIVKSTGGDSISFDVPDHRGSTPPNGHVRAPSGVTRFGLGLESALHGAGKPIEFEVPLK